MKPTLRIHTVLGSARSLQPTLGPTNPCIHLPGGLTATRWLSQGASTSAGWPLSVEGTLNDGKACARHCVLNLSRPEVGLDVLTDELDPGYQNGLPWILAVLGDVSAQVASLGAKASPGWVFLDLDTPCDSRRVKKVHSWCARQGLEMAVVGEVSGIVPPALTILPFQVHTVIRDITEFLTTMEFKL